MTKNKNRTKEVRAKIGEKGIYSGLGFFALCVFIVVAGQQILSLILANIHGVNTDKTARLELTNNNTLGLEIVLGILVITIFYIIFDMGKSTAKREWMLYSAALKTNVLAALTGVSFSFAYIFITYDSVLDNNKILYDSLDFYGNVHPILGYILLFLASFIVVPVAKEIVMRGTVYTRIDKDYGAAPAIIISAVIECLVPLIYGTAAQAVQAVLLGFIIGLIFMKTNSLYTCILVQALAQIPVMALFFHPYMTVPVRVGLAVLSAVIMLVCLIIILRGGKDYSLIIGSRVKGNVIIAAGEKDQKRGEISPLNYGCVQDLAKTHDGVCAQNSPKVHNTEAYILGTSQPLEEFEGEVVAVYHRYDDKKDILIVNLSDNIYSDEEILDKIEFREKEHNGELIL